MNRSRLKVWWLGILSLPLFDLSSEGGLPLSSARAFSLWDGSVDSLLLDNVGDEV